MEQSLAGCSVPPLTLTKFEEPTLPVWKVRTKKEQVPQFGPSYNPLFKNFHEFEVENVSQSHQTGLRSRLQCLAIYQVSVSRITACGRIDLLVTNVEETTHSRRLLAYSSTLPTGNLDTPPRGHHPILST